MKRYLLILACMFVLFVIGVSAALASIALPPNNPTADPPGKEIPIEQQIAAQAVKRCGDNYDSDRHVCAGMAVGAEACYREARERFRRCMDGVKYFLLGPPDLILPNGGSPGQGN